MPKTDQRLANVTAALAPLFAFAADEKNIAKTPRGSSAQKKGTANLMMLHPKLHATSRHLMTPSKTLCLSAKKFYHLPVTALHNPESAHVHRRSGDISSSCEGFDVHHQSHYCLCGRQQPRRRPAADNSSNWRKLSWRATRPSKVASTRKPSSTTALA